MTAPVPDVAVITVAYNSAGDLPVFDRSALAQEGVEVEILVVDNNSLDGSAEIAAGLSERVKVIRLAANRGFAGAMNVGIDATRGRYVVALNPDCRLEAGFLAGLVERLDERLDARSASGRLLRATGPTLSPTGLLRLDQASDLPRPAATSTGEPEPPRVVT